MKIDDRADAVLAARSLANAQADRVAEALLEAHLEGIEQARSQFTPGKSLEQISNELKLRSDFIKSQILKK